MSEIVEKKKRVRRTAEQRLADLEQKRLEILEKQRAALAKIEEAQRRLTENRGNRKEILERQKRFERAAKVLAPEWDHRHFIAAAEVVLAQEANAEELLARGEALLEEHGKARRGRRPRGVAA